MSQRIAVVGAGIVGVSAAEWLRRDGHAVTLIDRNDPGAPEQTSYGNAGVFAGCGVIPVPSPGMMKKVPGMLFSPMGPLHLKWGYLPKLLPWLIPFLKRANRADVKRTAAALADIVGDATEQHLALASGTGAERFIQKGFYGFFYTSREAAKADAGGHALRQSHGFRAEEWDRTRILEEDPHLGPHYNFAICYPGNGWVTDPGGYVGALFAHFRGEGGVFLRAEVEDIQPTETGAKVAAGGESLDFDQVVLAGGVWSAKLAARLGHDAAMESERGYHLVLKGANRRPAFPYQLSDGKMVTTPMDGGLRVAGQVEFGGLEAGPSEAPIRHARARARLVYPDLEWNGEERWLGHRPSTVDSLPFIGPSPKAPHIHFAFGAQHIGLTSGPKTGRLIADLIGGRRPNIDLTPFRVGRFDQGRAPK